MMVRAYNPNGRPEKADLNNPGMTKGNNCKIERNKKQIGNQKKCRKIEVNMEEKI